MEDIDKHIHGWKMRIFQAEEDIYLINKRRGEMIKIKEGLEEEKRNEEN